MYFVVFAPLDNDELFVALLHMVYDMRSMRDL